MPRVIVPVLLTPLLLAQSTGSVEGSVVDRVTGAGIPGASVTFYIRTQQGAIYDTTTDASGEFHIFGMGPGSYEVRFEKDGYRFGNKVPPRPYIVGETQSPVRMRLEMTRMVTLSGRVVDPDGNPMSQGEVRVVNRNTVPVAADGTFTIKDLEPGSYTPAAVPKATRVPEGARVPVVTYSPEPIVIRGDVDISGYEIRLETAEVFRVSGVVLDETGNPKPKVLVQLLPRIQSATRAFGGGDFITFVGPGPSVGPPEARVISGEDGSFEFPAVRSGPGFYPVSVSMGGEVLGKPVDLFPGSSFRVTYKAANGSVHGTVDNCNGAIVVLIPKNVQTIAFGRVTACKTDGAFDVPGVAPGDYSAAALRASTLDPRDSQLLARIASAGISVSVAQSAVSVKLSVNPSLE